MHKKHVHTKCIKSALARAEEMCAQNNLRLTDIRRKVLELIWQSHKPIKAYDLIAQLSTEDYVEKPPTVYRALQFLLDNHMIHRIESCNGYVGCTYDHTKADSKFLICNLCNEVEELHEPEVNQTLIDTSKKLGFIPDQFNVEIHGICSRCAK